MVCDKWETFTSCRENSNIVIVTNRPHLGPRLRSAFNGRLSIWKRFKDKCVEEIEVNPDNSLSDGLRISRVIGIEKLVLHVLSSRKTKNCVF